jgi:hypothetical protein
MEIKDFKPSELNSIYNSKKVVFFKFRKVYVLEYSYNCGFFFIEKEGLFAQGKAYTKRGKVENYTATEANEKIGTKFFYA